MRARTKILMIVALVGAFVLAFGGAAFAQFDDMPAGDLVDQDPSASALDPEEQAAREDPDGGVDAPAADVGNHEPECTDADEELPFDVPAIDGCETADGRTILDLPGVKVVSPADPGEEPAAPHRPDAPRRLPVTGVNVGDFLALGMAALSGGGVLLRRLRLSLTS